MVTIGLLLCYFVVVQLSGWWFLTFTASEIKERVQYLTGVQYLYDTINPDQLDIQQFVLDYDKEVGRWGGVIRCCRVVLMLIQQMDKCCVCVCVHVVLESEREGAWECERMWGCM